MIKRTVQQARPLPTVNSGRALDKRARRLRGNAEAIAHLAKLGLTQATIEHFRLGMREPYLDRDGLTHADALTAPVPTADGAFDKRHAYLRIPGVTIPVDGPADWMAGEPLAYFADPIARQKVMIVVGDLPDLWRLWQALKGWGVLDDYMVVTACPSGSLPSSWLAANWWVRWGRIFLCCPDTAAGDRRAIAIASHAGRDCFRLALPGAPEATSWVEWFRRGRRTFADFHALLEAAKPVSMSVQVDQGDHADWDGFYEYVPVNIHGAYRHGHLYYATEVLVRSTVPVTPSKGAPEDRAEIVKAEHLETFVVRSDRTLHQAQVMPAPKSALRGKSVLRLVPDGAALDRLPTPDRYATWQWPSIDRFIKGTGPERPLKELLADVEGHLRHAIWLPNPDDYAILAAGIVVSYCQAVFQAVPLFMVSGPPGSGKSALAYLSTKLAANGVLVGQISSASAARLIDMSRGWVAFDDLEQIAAKTGDKAQFSDLVQALKLSYNAETAVKVWTDPRTLRTSTLNFFGVKLINNTRGVDDILGSRMIRIFTRTLTAERKKAIGDLPPAPRTGTDALRQQLHTWAFVTVGKIATTYERLFNSPSDRAEEISAPLRVVAQLSGDATFQQRVVAGLERQTRPAMVEDPKKVLAEVARKLVMTGYRRLSPIQVRMEMALAMNATLDRGSDQTPIWQHGEWIGKSLREIGVLDPTNPGQRPNVPGTRYQIRIYAVRDDFLAQVAEQLGAAPQEREPLDFCGASCEGCPYRPVPCPIERHRPRAAR